MSKQARLQEFFRRLLEAGPVGGEQDALELISRILCEVEDEMTDIPFDPDAWMDDGRMYPPQADSAFAVDGYPSVTRYRSRQHNTFISEWGAIEIQGTDRKVLLSKKGQDGRGVWG